MKALEELIEELVHINELLDDGHDAAALDELENQQGTVKTILDSLLAVDYYVSHGEMPVKVTNNEELLAAYNSHGMVNLRKLERHEIEDYTWEDCACL